MNNTNPKSATTAGLLGIFLGSVGAHSWYLGDKKKGIIHVCLAGSGLIVSILASVILPAALSFSTLLTWAGILAALGGISAAVMSGNALWGLIEGIIILSQGDDGLARKGYYTVSRQNYEYQQQQYQQQQQQQQPTQPQQPQNNNNQQY